MQLFRITKDRSKFFVAGPDWQALEKAGLRGIFESVDEVQKAVLNWLATPPPPEPEFPFPFQFTLRRALSVLTWLCITMGLNGAAQLNLNQGRDPHIALVGAGFASLGATIGALFGKPIYGAGIVLGFWFIAILAVLHLR